LVVVDDYYFNFIPIVSIEIGAQASKEALEKEKLKRLEQSLSQEQIAAQSYIEYLQKTPISQHPDQTPEFQAYYYLLLPFPFSSSAIFALS
jgi:hypothetical protein